MIIKEFRVPLPFTLEEYRIAQLYTVSQTSLEQTGGGEGVEILRNEPFEDPSLLGGKYTEGQYTHKVYHCKNKVPRTLAALAPKGSLVVHEESWDAFPYCKTVLTNPGYMKEDFLMSVETIHCDGGSSQSNVHGLPPDELKAREVVLIDIARPIAAGSIKTRGDAAQFESTTAERGPLEPGEWMHKTEPIMTAYKLVRCEFKWRGLQAIIEKTILNFQRKVFHIFHRKLFCSVDRWHGMTMQDIRNFEEKIAEVLEEQRGAGSIKEAAFDVS